MDNENNVGAAPGTLGAVVGIRWFTVSPPDEFVAHRPSLRAYERTRRLQYQTRDGIWHNVKEVYGHIANAAGEARVLASPPSACSAETPR